MMTSARPVAYIRKSVVRRDNEGDLSRDFQVAKVRELASDDGPALDIIAGDWGRSATTDKTDKRLAFLALLESIERGEVSTLYAYALDRLARSVQWSARLLDACERVGTTIVTAEGRFAPGDDAARLTFHVLAMTNEGAVRAMTAKSRSTRERRTIRKDRMGSPPYGWRLAARQRGEPVTWEPDPAESVDTILDAYRTAGSFHGAARLLNESKVEAPRGQTWYGSRVRDILKSARPEVAEVRQTTPRVAYGSSSGAIFRRLLRCHCGGIPTPNRQRSGAYSYRCPKGHSDRASHPVVQIPEAAIVEWAKAEAARFRVPGRRVALDSTNEAERERLAAKRGAIIDNFEDGIYGRGPTAKAERDRRLEKVDAELAAIIDEATIRDLPPIDWTWAPADLNAILARLFRSIDLGPDMLPVGADRIPPPEYWAD